MAPVDAVIVGSGPNGLAAAIVIAQTGRRVVVFEAADTPGGGCRSAELTLPGFVHDICSAVHPFALASPFFRSLPLASHGLDWIEPPAMLAHPLEDDQAALIYRTVAATAAELGQDADAYASVIGRIVDAWPQLENTVLAPLRWPRHPIAAARFGLRALQPAETLARRVFKTDAARALFAGIAAHGMVPLHMRPTGAIGLVLTTIAHVAGWSIPRGGAQRITNALIAHLRSLGGEVVTGTPVRSIDQLPPARAILCDLSPGPLLRIAGHRFPPRYRRALERYRYGMGVFKVDWALDAPIPWRNPRCALAATVHVGGHCPRLPSPSGHAGMATRLRGRSCCSPNRHSSIPPALPEGVTWCGRIATCHVSRRPTCCPASNNRSNGSRRGFANACSPAR
jgi:phytoene dehydrogenase-like protein